MGISAVDFWNMEVYELNQAIQEWEEERREKLVMWRMTNYIMARPHFDPKKPIPTVEQFHPFPWDSEFKTESEFIPYDEQIEFAIRLKRQHWIPNHWFLESEKYKHLARNGTADHDHGHSGTPGATESAEAGA